MGKLKAFSDAVEKHVAPATSPIAVKLLKHEKEIPEKTTRPKRDFERPIVPCQGAGLARRQGLSIAMLREDFSIDCPTGMIAFGVVEPPKWWLEGNLYRLVQETQEAAINRVNSYFRVEPGEYRGVMFSPIRQATFDPDMVMIYCNAAQAMRLVRAARFEDGYPLTPRIIATAVCSASVVQTVQTGKCQVSIPCGGDRELGFTKDDEIVFSAPFNRLNVITKGLDTISKVSTPHDLVTKIYLARGRSPHSKRYETLREILKQKLAS